MGKAYKDKKKAINRDRHEEKGIEITETNSLFII